ncbi:MAG TPA: hypothetical protein VJT31_01765 [Rugosimonospora sp.]|nr:hypothetical protein [Rugosimonospora sp.]
MSARLYLVGALLHVAGVAAGWAVLAGIGGVDALAAAAWYVWRPPGALPVVVRRALLAGLLCLAVAMTLPPTRDRWQAYLILLGCACLVAAVAALPLRRRRLGALAAVAVFLALVLGSRPLPDGTYWIVEEFFATLLHLQPALAIGVPLLLAGAAAAIVHRRRRRGAPVPVGGALRLVGCAALAIPLWTAMASASVLSPHVDWRNTFTATAVAVGPISGTDEREVTWAVALLTGVACIVAGCARRRPIPVTIGR